MPASIGQLKVLLLRRSIRNKQARAAFVIAAPRCGATALYRALNQNSKIIFANGPAPLTHWCGKIAHAYSSRPARYRRYTALDEDSIRRKLRSFCFECIWGELDRVVLASAKSSPVRGRFRPRRVWMWGARASADEHAAQGLEWLFPQARFLHIYRNGIDVVYSMSRFSAFRDWPFVDLCRFWARTCKRYEYLRHRSNALAIKFEDFLDKPGIVLSDVCSYLGLPFETGMLRYATENLVHPLDGPTIRASARSVLKARAPSYVNWSSVERQTFRSICENAMQRLGYPIPF